MGKGGFYGNVFRVTPPLCFTKEDAGRVLSSLSCLVILLHFISVKSILMLSLLSCRLLCGCYGLCNVKDLSMSMILEGSGSGLPLQLI